MLLYLWEYYTSLTFFRDKALHQSTIWSWIFCYALIIVPKYSRLQFQWYIYAFLLVFLKLCYLTLFFFFLTLDNSHLSKLEESWLKGRLALKWRKLKRSKNKHVKLQQVCEFRWLFLSSFIPQRIFNQII